MQRLGHIGAALLAALPLGTGLQYAGEPRLAALALIVAATSSSIPDFDQELPIRHRGPTHTAWFVAVCTAVATVTGWLLASETIGLVVGAAAGLSLASHLAADSITPMGIRPFLPLSGEEYCFDIVYAANKRANRLLFGAGAVTTAVSQAAVAV